MSTHRNPKTIRSERFVGVNIARQDDAGSPGLDGASPYLSRVFRLILPCDVAPTGIRKRTDPERFVGVNIARRGDAGSPGSDGASPYLSRVFRLASPCTVIPQESENDPYQKDSWGLTLQGGATREAPVRTEPHPTFPLASPCNVIPQESENDPYQKDSWGLTLQDGATREAPVRTELHP